ncbi:MAG: DUF1801 domain-containing protein [Rhodothalassiaceae bacterium]
MAIGRVGPSDTSAEAFLARLQPARFRADAERIAAIMARITGEPPVLWGHDIIGFGHYHYHYADGRSGDWMLTGFAPRRGVLVLYIMSGFTRFQPLLDRLCRFRSGRSCLYVERLSDIRLEVLEELVAASVAHLRAMYRD